MQVILGEYSTMSRSELFMYIFRSLGRLFTTSVVIAINPYRLMLLDAAFANSK